MKTKKYKQGLVTSLTALSTAMLCQTATTYASDIEIYKAPTSGGATLMLVLDTSASMQTPVQGKNGGYENPINKDFGISCSTNSTGGALVEGRSYEQVFDRTFVTTETPRETHTYPIIGRYCNVKKSTVNALSDLNKKALIVKSCELFTASSTEYYRCPDRLTTLKHSLFDLIIGSDTNERLPSTATIGFRTFPTDVKQAALVLTEQNRAALLTAIADLKTANNTPISKAYATGAKDLFEHISTSEAACAGYGVYFLTDGAPTNDSESTARTLINPYLSTGYKVNTCSGSWTCVAAFAEPLQQKNNTQNVEIKTAIVGFGKDFSFTHKNDSSQNVEYDKDQLKTYTDTWLAARFSGNALDASKAAVKGGGGWYSASSKADIVSSVDNFVNSIKVPIPAITTGSSAIPQDVLNTSVIQPYAYFPQFQPKPSDEFRAWTGNLKKYNVSGGILKDKNNTALFGNAGVLNPANEDLWTPNYAANATLTADQQSLKALGGLLSRLNLKKTGSNLNRKVFTSDGATLTAVNEAYIKANPTTRGYYLGLLGYDITEADVQRLTSSFDLSTLPQTTSELRQIGAVMHSSPVLLTQSGKISFVAAKAAVPATETKPAEPAQAAYNDTTDRDDYVLFGTTQGVLHVVKAGKSSEITTVGNTAGQEVFAFVPQEMLAAQGKAFLDPPQTVEAGSSTNGMSHLYYGVDGAWTAHTEYVYNNANETFKVYDSATKYGKQWVYGGLRMGGRSYYALDLTNMESPAVKFRINPATNSVDGFTTPSGEETRYQALGKMGQSWSKPTIANVQWKGKRRLVMFVGGGYDAGYERINYAQINGIGAGVYMFDANTGEFLWSTYDAKAAAGSTTTYIGHGDELKYSVVSQIKGVDRDGDGDVDHLYFGDLGGQVFRVDLNSTHSASSTAANYASQITRIYNGHLDNGVSPRFYEMPAFTVYQGTGSVFAVISIGSGNRSTPLLGKKVNGSYITANETDTAAEATAASGKVLNSSFVNDAIYNIYDTVVTAKNPAAAALATSPTQSSLFVITDNNRELSAITAQQKTPANLAANKENSDYKGWYYAFASSTARKAVEKVQGDLIAIDNDLYVSTFDAEGTDSTASCGAGIYGTSNAHRFCMPYGQCANGDTVANNTLNLGKGLLGITMGPGSDPSSRRIIASLGSLNAANKITGTTYNAANKLIPQSWYEKN